jgi:hypothetical protein
VRDIAPSYNVSHSTISQRNLRFEPGDRAM